MTSDSRTTAGTVRGDWVCHRVSATQEGLGGLSHGTAPPRPRLPAALPRRRGPELRGFDSLGTAERRSRFWAVRLLAAPDPCGLALGS